MHFLNFEDSAEEESTLSIQVKVKALEAKINENNEILFGRPRDTQIEALLPLSIFEKFGIP